MGTGGSEGTIGGLGEFGLIAAVVAELPQADAVLLGPGDDAAVVRIADGRVVATTDVLVEGRHFRRDWSTAYDVGRKAAAANLADVAAMGARPVALLVGLAAPASLPVTDVLDLTRGLRDEGQVAAASVVGGDVVEADALTVAVTALGTLDGREPVTRAGGQVGDTVAVCGRLGWSAAGLALLSAGESGPAELLAAYHRPAPPYAAGPRVAAAGARAMCDVSDGLLRDLGHIARASGVRVEVDVAACPVDHPVAEAAARLGVDPLTWVLTGGEDHALVACFAASSPPPRGWQVIGRAVPGELVGAGGYEQRTGGWEHFR
jgi:thiamine-monophosphate kinase